MRGLCYISAPLRLGDRTRNVNRAKALGRLAQRRGLAPIVVHVLGDVFDMDDKVAFECDLAIVSAVAKEGGVLWVLLTDEGSVTEGCRLEVEAYERSGGLMVVSKTWDQYRSRAVSLGLGDLWNSLEVT